MNLIRKRYLIVFLIQKEIMYINPAFSENSSSLSNGKLFYLPFDNEEQHKIGYLDTTFRISSLKQ